MSSILPPQAVTAMKFDPGRPYILWPKHSGRFVPFLACSFGLFVNTAGCRWQDDSAKTPGYMPSWEEARQSLVSALTAWRDAPASAPLPASFDTEAVKFLDKRRRPDQRLRAFEILSELDIENARQFTVRLSLEGEDTPQLVKYNIVGRQPVWVFRLEDYEMFSHWEHDMDEPAETEVAKTK
jgi:hypothetical protein